MEPTTYASTRLVTIPEAADQLALSTRMVERLIAVGDLVPLRIGRAVRIADSEIEDFIERKRQNDSDPAANRVRGKEANHDGLSDAE